ncbi:MAG: bifunctional oligoribonuclease/PAP phosphatase NrnA [Verrucomicrobiota bacterium]
MKSVPQIIRRLIEEIRQHQTFCIVGHVRPDGDCIGSQLALALALRHEGKTVTCWNEDSVPDKLKFLDPDKVFEKPNRSDEFDCVIATDCASFERLGRVGAAIGKRKILLNIDHHQSNTRYGDLNWVSGREASTGELIYKLLKAAGWPISRQIANCLFTAVSTDTGSFQYPTTKPLTYHTAGELVQRGADLAKICDEVYQSHPMSRVRLLRHLYTKFRLTHHDKIAYLWLKKKDFTRAGAETQESEGLIDHLRDMRPVEVACLFEELEPELTRISLRSKTEKVNVNEIAAHFGGGGHKAAAGARIVGRPMSVQRQVVAAIKKALNKAA